jgi:hypothetical protein
MRARRKFYKARTNLAKVGFPTTMVSEDLTPTRSNILYNARELRRNDIIHDCWSYEGGLFAKKAMGGRPSSVSTMTKLERASGYKMISEDKESTIVSKHKKKDRHSKDKKLQPPSNNNTRRDTPMPQRIQPRQSKRPRSNNGDQSFQEPSDHDITLKKTPVMNASPNQPSTSNNDVVVTAITTALNQAMSSNQSLPNSSTPNNNRIIGSDQNDEQSAMEYLDQVAAEINIGSPK